jgi:predicted O-methyltransferase YrrM
LTKNQKKLLTKVNAFHKWLLNDSKLNVKILDIDDGVAIISKSN